METQATLVPEGNRIETDRFGTGSSSGKEYVTARTPSTQIERSMDWKEDLLAK
jgi:hypothetical protein